MYTRIGGTFPILPEHINVDHFPKSGNAHRTEVASYWILLFCLRRGQKWKSLKVEDLQEFFHQNGGEKDKGVHYEVLAGKGFLIVDGNRIIPTAEFVTTCFLNAPNPSVVEAPREGDTTMD